MVRCKKYEEKQRKYLTLSRNFRKLRGCHSWNWDEFVKKNEKKLKKHLTFSFFCCKFGIC